MIHFLHMFCASMVQTGSGILFAFWLMGWRGNAAPDATAWRARWMVGRLWYYFAAAAVVWLLTLEV